jgi:hypothetical protein
MPHSYTLEVPLSDRLALNMAEVAKVTGLSPSEIQGLIDAGSFETVKVGRHRVATMNAIARMLGVTREELLGLHARPMAPRITIGKAAA